MPHHRFLVLLVLGAGCADDKALDETGGETATPDTAAATPLCADGTWGSISDPTSAVFVTVGGADDTGDGTQDRPFLTVATALARTRQADAPKRIALGDGAFDAQFALVHEVGDGTTDDGLAIEGCGPGATTLVPLDADDYVIQATGVQGWSAAGFTIQGGRRAVWIWQAGTATLSDVVVDGATRTGIVMDGSYGLIDVTLQDVVVAGVSADSDGSGYGYGIAVQGGTATDTVTLRMSGGEVSSATQAGIFVTGDKGAAILSGVRIMDILANADGLYGRGVQVQGGATLEADTVELSGNADAAIYAHESYGVTLTDVTVTDVAEGMDETGAPTGDGIVLTQDPANAYAPESFPFTLTSVTVTNAPRAGVLLSGVAGTATDTTGTGLWTGLADGASTFGDLGYVGAIATQDGASVTHTGLDVQDLDVEPDLSALTVNVVQLAADDLAD